MLYDNSITQLYSARTQLPPDTLITAHAKTYMEGFNNSPWDIYEYNLTLQKAQKELYFLIHTIIKERGACLSIALDGVPVGFTLVTDMSIFNRRLEQVVGFKRLPKDFVNPGDYLEKVSRKIWTPFHDFHKVGYIAVIAVDKHYRGKGLGKKLIKDSLEYFSEHQKCSALAWSINPAMIKIFRDLEFTRITGLGKDGEGIDLLVQGKVWYPILERPKKRPLQKENKITAEHWLKSL